MYTKKQLERAIKCNESYSSVLRCFKMNTSGGNYKKLKRDIEEWKLDISHFLNHAETCRKIFKGNVKYTLEEILTNIKPASTNFKQKLYDVGLKQPICEECGQGEEWRGKKIQLQLDHIDGDHYNNKLNNLKILCPNCHSITDTFAGRNKDKTFNKKQQINKLLIKKEQNNKERVDTIEILKNKILKTGIDITKRGYGIKLSKLLDVSPAYILRIMPNLFPEINIYKSPSLLRK